MIKERTKEKLISIGLVSPTVLAIGIFVYGFIGWTIKLSFSDWNTFAKLLKGKFKFVGLSNYIKLLFQDPRFPSDLWNTLFFTILFLLGCVALGIILALLLDRGLKGSIIFQNIYLFPMAVAFVVTGTAWRWIFAPGISAYPQGINLLFSKLGLDALRWRWFVSTEHIGPFNLALIPIVIAATWQLSGYVMAMCLAGLRGIPSQLIEAAQVDGASGWQVFWGVKFPLLRHIIFSAMIILGHISLKIFDLVFSMTGSGPNLAVDVPALYMFETTFERLRYARGAAIAIIMLIMVSFIIIPYLISSMKREAKK